MKRPLVSILMPVFNGEAYVAQAIQAVLAQDYKNFTLFILDDGSTDNTKIIIKNFLEDRRVLVVSEYSNKGIIYTRNKGLNMVKTDYFAFVDADDVVEPGWLSEQVLYLDENSEVAAVGCWLQSVDANLNLIENGVWYSQESSAKNACYLLRGSPLSMSATLFRREMIKGIYFSDKYPAAEDYGYWADLIMVRNCRLANVQKILIKYRRHSMQTSTEKKILQAQSHLNVFKEVFVKMDLSFSQDDIVRHAVLVEFFDENLLFDNLKEVIDFSFLIWALSWILNIFRNYQLEIISKSDLFNFFIKYWRRVCRKSIKNIGLYKAVPMFLWGYFCMLFARYKNS